MNFDLISRNLRRVGLKAYKHRADIAFVSGMGLTAVGTGLFIKSTFKQVKIKEEKEAELFEAEKYPEEEQKKLKKKVGRDTLKQTVNNYAMPVVVSAVGYGLEIYAHQSVKADFVIASTALNGMTAAYEALREKIIEAEGEDKWAEYAYGARVEDYIDFENPDGEITKGVKYQNNIAPHCYLFYEPNPNWNRNKGCNKAFLLQMQDCFNHSLSHKGILFEHEVLEGLGYDIEFEVKNGKIFHPAAGWVYRNPDGTTNSVDLGLMTTDEATLRFMREQEPSVMLKLNCVENVYDLI